VLFFCYDLAKYIAKDRALNFDYEQVAPGPKCFTQQQLQAELTKCLRQQQDDYVAGREQVRDQMFASHDDQAAVRIAAEILTRFCH